MVLTSRTVDGAGGSRRAGRPRPVAAVETAVRRQLGDVPCDHGGRRSMTRFAGLQKIGGRVGRQYWRRSVARWRRPPAESGIKRRQKAVVVVVPSPVTRNSSPNIRAACRAGVPSLQVYDCEIFSARKAQYTPPMRRNCRVESRRVGDVNAPVGSRCELVANCVHTADADDATQLDSCIPSAVCIGH